MYTICIRNAYITPHSIWVIEKKYGFAGFFFKKGIFLLGIVYENNYLCLYACPYAHT